MNIAFVIKDNYQNCPPLVRLLWRLSDNGHKVDIFCVGKHLSFKEINKNIKIICVPEAKGIATNFRPLLEIPRLKKALIKFDHAVDICIAFDPYALEAVRQSRTYKKIPVIYYSLELWDEFRFWPQRLFETVGHKILKGIISPQETRLAYLKKKFNLKIQSMIFPNTTYDYFEELDEDQRTLRNQLKYFVYIGGLQKGRAIPQLLEVFGNRIPHSHLIIYGKGTKRFNKRIKYLINSLKYKDNIRINEFLTYPNHYKKIRYMYVGIMLYENISLNYRYCAPNKLYEYSMMGIPILSSNQPHLKNCIEKYGMGICVDPNDVNEIEQGVRMFIDKTDIDVMSNNARQWFIKNGSYDIFFAKFLQFCESII